MYYYELHEGDDDLMSDVILACETEVSPDDFFELVQEVRREVQDAFDEDSLIEAIAVELERSHGYTFVSDERLAASVLVSRKDDDNLLIEMDADDDDGAYEDADELGQDDGVLPGYRSLIVDVDRSARPD
ncbi:MAG: hypothetical protein WCH74_04210 [Chloroflexota bacterium]